MSVGVFLGGDTVSRGVLRTSRAEAGDIATLGVFVAGAVTVLTVWVPRCGQLCPPLGSQLLASSCACPWQLDRDATGGTSLRGLVGRTGWLRWRRRHGLTSFDPTAKLPVPAGVENANDDG